MVGRVGIEPTMFLMCLIYSQVRSPATHIYRYKVRLGPRLPAHRGLLTHYGVPPVAATYFATHLRLGGRLRCRSPYSLSPYNLFSRQFQRPLWLTFHIERLFTLVDSYAYYSTPRHSLTVGFDPQPAPNRSRATHYTLLSWSA